jgi:hypothetical protein
MIFQVGGLEARLVTLLCKKKYYCEIQKKSETRILYRQIWQILPKKAIARKWLFWQ